MGLIVVLARIAVVLPGLPCFVLVCLALKITVLLEVLSSGGLYARLMILSICEGISYYIYTFSGINYGKIVGGSSWRTVAEWNWLFVSS